MSVVLIFLSLSARKEISVFLGLTQMFWSFWMFKCFFFFFLRERGCWLTCNKCNENSDNQWKMWTLLCLMSHVKMVRVHRALPTSGETVLARIIICGPASIGDLTRASSTLQTHVKRLNTRSLMKSHWAFPIDDTFKNISGHWWKDTQKFWLYFTRICKTGFQLRN